MTGCCGRKEVSPAPKPWEGWMLGVIAVLVITGSIVKAAINGVHGDPAPQKPGKSVSSI